MTVHSVLHELPASYKKLQQFREETELDDDLSQLKQFIRNGLPDKRADLSTELKHCLKRKWMTCMSWTEYCSSTVRSSFLSR